MMVALDANAILDSDASAKGIFKNLSNQKKTTFYVAASPFVGCCPASHSPAYP